MQAILLLLPEILKYLPTAVVGVEELIAWIGKIRTAAQQSGEWTPELEIAFLQSLLATKRDPAYQPDPARFGPTLVATTPMNPALMVPAQVAAMLPRAALAPTAAAIPASADGNFNAVPAASTPAAAKIPSNVVTPAPLVL